MTSCDDSPGNKIRALRTRLGLTQEGVAERGGGIDRTEVVAVETGRNKATTVRIRGALARGLGLSIEQLGAFLSGDLGIDEVETLARATVLPATGTG